MSPTKLIDNFGRPITYLRLAVTDRCNLRCYYCMPAQGIDYLPRKELLTYEEMERLISVVCEMGVKKVRITGGEPFIRRDMITFLEKILNTPGLEEVHITTNGVLTAPYIPHLKAMGIASVNLSLDTLDRQRFLDITRRDEFNNVIKSFYQLLEADIAVKLNMVVMEGKNIQDIIPMAELTRELPVSVRYIEEMPFNGSGPHRSLIKWDHAQILSTLKTTYPELTKQKDPDSSTAAHYQIPGSKGNLGIIAAYTRTFCGSCNRIRVTAQGILKTCLYDHGAIDIKKIIRENDSNEPLREALYKAINSRFKDGWAAENSRNRKDIHESMSTIGG